MGIKDSREPVRVLCVFATLNQGGAETMCMNLYRHIDREKVQFDFVKHTSEECAYEREIRNYGGRIYEAPHYIIANHIAYCAWWKKHFEQHPEHQIIHGHFFTIAGIYFKIAKKYKRITIGHSHCTQSDIKTLKNYLSIYFSKQMDKYSDVRFACSVPAGKWIFKKGPFIVLKNAIDTDQYSFDSEVRRDVKKELDLEGKYVIGTVGRIVRQKNPLGIINIFLEVLNRKSNAILLWAGDGPMRKEAEDRIQKLGISDKVKMLGVRTDVNRVMQAMDVFIFPSFYEGLGIAAIEAQAADLPCYVSDKIPKEVQVTEKCVFLPIDDVKNWASVICQESRKRENRKKEVIDAGYDVAQSAKWVTAFYLSLQNGSNIEMIH